jgi:hypothetical protein
LRVTSAIWVAALIRRCYGAGIAAALVRRGAEEAGAIFVSIDFLDGTSDLYAPAPQTSFDERNPSDRKFQRILERAAQETIAERLDRERRFDPDIWVVAIEDREGRVFFDVV